MPAYDPSKYFDNFDNLAGLSMNIPPNKEPTPEELERWKDYRGNTRSNPITGGIKGQEDNSGRVLALTNLQDQSFVSPELAAKLQGFLDNIYARRAEAAQADKERSAGFKKWLEENGINPDSLGGGGGGTGSGRSGGRGGISK